MEISSVFRQLLVFAHLFAFAFAIVSVVKHDILLLKSDSINIRGLDSAAKQLMWLLLVLWVTGAILIYMAVGTDMDLLLSNAKLMSKISIVGILTINGLLLHYVAFPMLSGQTRFNSTICSVLGAISTTSWLFAGFVGACRVLGPQLSYTQFMAIYAASLMFALLIAVTFVKSLLDARDKNRVKLLPENSGEYLAQS